MTSTTTLVEVGIEFHLPTDYTHWIPNGFEMVELTVDTNLLLDDRSVAIDEAADEWCKKNGFGFSQVIESDFW